MSKSEIHSPAPQYLPVAEERPAEPMPGRGWRRRFSAGIAAASLLISAGCGLEYSQPESQAFMGGEAGMTQIGQHRPNVLVFMIDDGRKDDMRAMPKTRHWLGGDNGVTFENALSPNPLCCPARAELVSGQYTHNNHVLTNRGKDGGYRAINDKNTLATWGKQAGVSVEWIGKTMNGFGERHPRYVPPGWSYWNVPVRHIYDYNKVTMDNNGRLVHHDGYKATYYGKLIRNRLGEWAHHRQRPHVMIASFLAPHDTPDGHGGWTAPPGEPKYRGSYIGKMPPITNPAFAEKDTSDKPAYIRKLGHLSATAIKGVMRTRRKRQEALRSVDDQMGSIMHRLQSTGLLKNTDVLFLSDNGYELGEHNKPAGKIVPYVESNTVPLLASGPDFPNGATVDRLVAIPDITKTIVNLTHMSPKRTLDGVNLVKLINNPDMAADRPIELEAGSHLMPGWHTATYHRSYFGLRVQNGAADWQYVRYYTGEEELYDLANDPHQLQNLADNPTYQAVLQQMEQRTKTLKDCGGVSCREPFVISNEPAPAAAPSSQ